MASARPGPVGHPDRAAGRGRRPDVWAQQAGPGGPSARWRRCWPGRLPRAAKRR